MIRLISTLLKDLFFTALLKVGLTSFDRLQVNDLYIVTFHRVLPDKYRKQYPFPGLVVTPEEFEWYLRIFSKYFICGSLSTLYEQWQNGETREKPFLAITFDDGQLDNYLYAKPILDKFGIKSTFYVPTDAIDNNEMLWHDKLGFSIIYLVENNPEIAFKSLSKIGFNSIDHLSTKEIIRIVTNQAKKAEPDIRNTWINQLYEFIDIKNDVFPEWSKTMNWELLSCLVKEGHEIGSHSVSHNLLSQLSKDEVKIEVESSQEIINKKLNIKIKSFCYPDGNYSSFVENTVDLAGYKNAVTTEYGVNKQNNPFKLKRFDIVTSNIVNRKNNLSIDRISWRMNHLFELWNNR